MSFTLEWVNKIVSKKGSFFPPHTISQPCINLSIPIKLKIFSSEIKGTCRSSRGVCGSAIGGLGRTADVPLLIMLHKASTQTGMFILTKVELSSLNPHICVSFCSPLNLDEDISYKSFPPKIQSLCCMGSLLLVRFRKALFQVYSLASCASSLIYSVTILTKIIISSFKSGCSICFFFFNPQKTLDSSTKHSKVIKKVN